MALISNIGACIFTKLKYKADSTYTLPTSASEHQTFIAGGGDFNGATEVTNVREFPSFGKPANIVNVPSYGQSVTSQIQGSSKQKVPSRLEATNMNVAPEAPSSDPAE